MNYTIPGGVAKWPRRRSAKPLFPGSNPGAASSFSDSTGLFQRSRVLVLFFQDPSTVLQIVFLMKYPVRCKFEAEQDMKKRLPLIIFLLSSCLLLAGIYFGEAKDVFHEAVTICLSCIGIG